MMTLLLGAVKERKHGILGKEQRVYFAGRVQVLVYTETRWAGGQGVCLSSV